MKAMFSIGGINIPVSIEHEFGNDSECVFVCSVPLPNHAVIHPGARIRIPSNLLTNKTDK